MANRRDYYFKQKVTEAELDAGFDGLETADRNLVTDANLIGIYQALAVSQQVSPNLTVQVSGPGAAYDQVGQRIAIPSTQNADLSVDDSSVSTAVTTPGNSRIVSLFIRFKRALSDLRIDGNSATVYFVRAESFEFVVNAGAEAVGPTPPALRSDAILLADVTRSYGVSTIVNGNISTTRRQFAIKTGLIAVGTVLEAIAAVTAATSLNYGGGGAWADSTTNPAATVEAQLDKIISDLTSTTGTRGAGKLTAPARGNWADSTTNPATTLDAAIAKIVTDLASAGGLNKIGKLTGTGEILYSSARLRKIPLSPLILQASTGPDQTSTILKQPGNDPAASGTLLCKATLQTNSGLYFADLNPYIREGMTIADLRVTCTPGAARAGGARVEVRFARQQYNSDQLTWDNDDPSEPNWEYDDGTANHQTISLAADPDFFNLTLHRDVVRSAQACSYYVLIKAGNTAGAANDMIHNIELWVNELGPTGTS